MASLLPCQLPQQAAGSHIRGAGGIGQIGPPVRQLILDKVLNEPNAAHGPACKAAPALRRYLRCSRHRRSPRPLWNILCPRFSRWLPTGGPHLRVRVQLRRYPLPDTVAALRVHVLHLLHMQPPLFLALFYAPAGKNVPVHCFFPKTLLKCMICKAFCGMSSPFRRGPIYSKGGIVPCWN